MVLKCMCLEIAGVGRLQTCVFRITFEHGFTNITLLNNLMVTLGVAV